MKNQDRIRNRHSRAVSLQAAVALLLLICCLASCSREEDAALSLSGDNPSPGRPVSLCIGSVSVTHPDGTATTRAKEWFNPDHGDRVVKIYVFTKNGPLYQCTSEVIGVMMNDGFIYDSTYEGVGNVVYPRIYIGSTVRIITILIDKPLAYGDLELPDWVPAFPHHPEWGVTEIPMDLRLGNFLVADSGDLDSRSFKVYHLDNNPDGLECCHYDIDYHYYTSGLTLLCDNPVPDKISVTVKGLALQGSWVLGTETFKVSPGSSRESVMSDMSKFNGYRLTLSVIPEKGVSATLTANEFVWNGTNHASGQTYTTPSRNWDKGKSFRIKMW